MNTTSSHLPICVHCGTPRPADETLCPTCGKPWIDTTIRTKPAADAVPPPAVPTTDAERGDEDQEDGSPTGAAIAATAAALAAAQIGDGDTEDEHVEAENTDTGAEAEDADGEEPNPANAGGVTTEESPVVIPPPLPPSGLDDTGEFAFDAWTQPTEDDLEPRRTAWLVPAGIAAAVVAAVAFLVFGGGNAPSTTTDAALNTTIASVSTTTAPVTTTTAATTTTAIAFLLPGDWPPVGDPIDTADLTLKQSAIGPINIGAPIDDVAGVLTASLGEATASGIDGLCPPDESYWLQFGQLTAIFDGFDSTSVFVAYRYDEPQGTDPELGLKTLSGVAIGDTVEDLINTYTQFTITFEIIDSKDHFQLIDGGELLLWGPVSSVDPAGLIEGIYSPTVCDTAP